MVFILKLTMKRYYSDLITIDVDTLFLHWDNTFPAVSICLVKGRNSTKVKEYLRSAEIPHSSTEMGFLKIIYFYLFMNPGAMQFTIKTECAGLNESCGLDIDLLRDTVSL